MEPTSKTFDIVIVGAGAAGLGAAARLRTTNVNALVVEARSRPGGRGHTVQTEDGLVLDLGCGWLHSADQNPWTAIAEKLCFHVDRSPAPWARPALEINFPAEDQRAYRKVFEAFEEKLERAAKDPIDRAASSLFTPEDARWRPLLDAFSGYYNGEAFDCISIHDYAAYQPTDENWRVREGYGALMTRFAEPLSIAYDTPVRCIDHTGARVKIITGKGEIEAGIVIVAVPTAVIAEEGIVFDPPLPQKREAAAALPLGHVNKAFLRLDRPEDFPADSRAYGRTDTIDTAGYSFNPMGQPVMEAYFGGDLAGRLEEQGRGALTDFAIGELVHIFGADFRKRLHPLAESGWSHDPFSRGAYSHAKPGNAGMRPVLAAPVDERLFFAGEACSPHAFSTAHGAYETGIAAAEAALRSLKP